LRGGHPPLVHLAHIAFAAQRDTTKYSPTDFQYPHFPIAVKSTSARLIQLPPALLAGQRRDDRTEQRGHGLPVLCQRCPQQRPTSDSGRSLARWLDRRLWRQVQDAYASLLPNRSRARSTWADSGMRHARSSLHIAWPVVRCVEHAVPARRRIGLSPTLCRGQLPIEERTPARNSGHAVVRDAEVR